MRGSDAYEDEMRIFSRLSDRVQDSVLAGRASAVDDELQELAAFCRDTRALYVQAPPESTAARHITELADAARRVAQGGGGSPASDRRSSNSPPQRRRWIPFSSLRTRMVVAATGFALLAGFGGGAYAGVLPDPIQDRVADIARNVGLSLPAARNEPHRDGIDKAHDSVKVNRSEPAQRTRDTGVELDRGESAQSKPDEGVEGHRGESGQSSSDQGAQENGGEPEQSNSGEGVEGNRGESEQRGSGPTPQADSQEHAKDKSDGPAQTSDVGQGTQTNGSEPTQDEQGADGGQTGSDPEGQASTGIEGG